MINDFTEPSLDLLFPEENVSKLPCECYNWAGTGQGVVTEHHPRCSHYDPLGDCRKIIIDLLDGMQIWAGDEDGIHPKAWDAFQRGSISVGQTNRIQIGVDE